MSLSVKQEYNQVYWYLMLHLDPSGIDKMLKYENEQRKSQNAPTILSLIPFLFLEHAASEKRLSQETKAEKGRADSRDEADAHNTLRNYLHDFVFIKSSRNEIDQLLNCDWNRNGRLHLHYCRTREGKPIRLTEKEMTPFIALFVEQRQKFSFRPYGQDTLHQQTVHIKRGLFKDYTATVMKVTQTAEGIRLTLSIPVFSNVFSLNLYDCSSADVDVPGGDLDQVFTPYFVQNMEQEFFAILRRKVFRRETPQTQRQDQQRLDECSVFNYLKFDTTDRQTHFQALMLLCATLRRDKPAKDTLIRELKAAISHPQALSTDEEAFVTAILFVATKDGTLRKAAKEYCQTHEVTLQSLLQLMPLIKEIKTR